MFWWQYEEEEKDEGIDPPPVGLNQSWGSELDQTWLGPEPEAGLPTPMARPQQEASPAPLPYQHKVKVVSPCFVSSVFSFIYIESVFRISC